MRCFLGHKWGDWVREDNSCTFVRRCQAAKCNAEQRKTEHHYSDWQFISDASCEQHKVCLHCGADFKETRVKHDYSDWEYIQSDSCEQFQKCHRCGNVEIRKADHKFGNWKYHSDGSCEQKRSCGHCGYTEYQIVHDPQGVPSDETPCRTDMICACCGQFLSSTEKHEWSKNLMPYAECLDISIDELERKKERLCKNIEGLKMHPTDAEFLRYSAAASRTEFLLKTCRDKRLAAQNNQIGRYCIKCKASNYCGLSGNQSNVVKGFMSYKSEDRDYANLIDKELRKHGCVITRDIRDLDIGSDIVRFMERIGDSGYVVALISENYLRSIYCMFEAAQIVNTLVKKGIAILPICIGVDLNRERESTIAYWNDQYRRVINGDLPAHKERMYSEIVRCLPEFFDIVMAEKYENVDQCEIDPVILKRIITRIVKISQ